jgi:hypothetical protein
MNTNEQKENYLFTTDDIKKIPRKINKIIKTAWKKRNGYVLIVLIFYVFIITLVAMMDPMLASALSLKRMWKRAAVERAEWMAIGTTSPIRYRIVSEVYDRVQKQLIDHIAKSKGTNPYLCAETLMQPTSAGGNLALEPSLCDPEGVIKDLNGLSNQSIDYLSKFYPDYKTPLTGENEIVRKGIIAQNTNTYQYWFTNTYIGHEVVNNQGFKDATGFTRQENYKWLIRADSEATLPNWFNVTWGIVANYDVNLTINYYPSNFAGGGDLCDRRDSNMGGRECPPEYQINGVCMPAFYTDKNGVEWPGDSGPCPYGTNNPQPECEIIGQCEDHGPITTCPLAGGGELSILKVRATRPQIGCASLNSGKSGKVIDTEGYSFILTVRMVSVGNTF